MTNLLNELVGAIYERVVNLTTLELVSSHPGLVVFNMVFKQFITLDISCELTFSKKIEFIYECSIYEVASLVVSGILDAKFLATLAKKLLKCSAISLLSHMFLSPNKGSFLYFIYNLLLYLIGFYITSVNHGFRFRYFCSTENVLTGKQSLYIFIYFLWNILYPCWHSLQYIILFQSALANRSRNEVIFFVVNMRLVIYCFVSAICPL